MGQNGSRLSQYHAAVLTGKEDTDKLFLGNAGLSPANVRFMCKYLDRHAKIRYVEYVGTWRADRSVEYLQTRVFGGVALVSVFLMSAFVGDSLSGNELEVESVARIAETLQANDNLQTLQ